MKVTIRCALVLGLLGSYSLANMPPEGFDAFLNYYFVETGTDNGNGVEKALKAGFKEIRSIEYNQSFFNRVKKRFSENPNVYLIHGDSSKDLWVLIEDIDQEITFWLDAHACPPRTDGGKNCPLIEELEQIGRHPIKTHIILIDDMHCAGTILFDGLTKDDLIKKIKEINPDYVISYVAGGEAGEYPNNIMVARVLTL